jgi:hypothetical protein
MSQDWVGRFVGQERLRQEEERRRTADAERRAESSAARLRSLMDVLDAQVAGDVAAFSREFPERRILFERLPADGGFQVRREHYPEVHLTVVPNADGTIHVQYLFAMESGTTAPKLLELVPDHGHAFSVRVKDGPGTPTLRGAERTSEYLLVPVFTGQPPAADVFVDG